VPVEAVVRDVQLAVVEPLRKGWRRPVEHLGEGFVPVQQLTGLLAPESLAVGGGALVQVGLGHGGGRELRRRRELAGLVEEMVDLAAHGTRSFAAGRVVHAARWW